MKAVYCPYCGGQLGAANGYSPFMAIRMASGRVMVSRTAPLRRYALDHSSSVSPYPLRSAVVLHTPPSSSNDRGCSLRSIQCSCDLVRLAALYAGFHSSGKYTLSKISRDISRNLTSSARGLFGYRQTRKCSNGAPNERNNIKPCNTCWTTGTSQTKACRSHLQAQ